MYNYANKKSVDSETFQPLSYQPDIHIFLKSARIAAT